MSAIWCNGEFREGPLAVAPQDRGLNHGLGVFETVLALDGFPVALELHLERMRRGARTLGLEPRWIDQETLGHAIEALLPRCGLHQGRARVRVSLTAGSGDLRALEAGRDSLLWITAAAAGDPPASISLVTATFPRNEASPLAGIKCLSYAENLIALDHAWHAGADECLFYNTRGEVCEATISNVFLVIGGEVVTPPLASGCLPGTMRERVIARCRELGIGVGERVLSEKDLLGAEEIFTTSAIRGVVPVSAIDGRVLSSQVGERLRSGWGRW